MDRKQGKQLKGVQKRDSIGQETRKKAERSPKAGPYWTGNPENSQKESENKPKFEQKPLEHLDIILNHSVGNSYSG
ncbi:hypothetical protein ACE38V_17595 [Cytobacillus sp. Hz8]|uniref:hypothetical protein n=1 Tax=Cytobacillus sp. Hz8 TaxID=3347168 RepID=UPI0035D63BED